MSEDVHVGHDGWLFLSGGSNEVLKYYQNPEYFESAKKIWLEMFTARYKNAQDRDILYRHIVVPDKISIYSEHFRDCLEYPNSAPSVSLPEFLEQSSDRKELSSLLIDVRGALINAKSSGKELFYRTDAHWTFDGVWIGYLALCHSIGATPNLEIANAPVTVGRLLLDLGSKLTPPVEEDYFSKQFIRGAERIFANPIVEYKESVNDHSLIGMHVGSQVIFRNTKTATDPRTIVLFGDSYSEYRPSGLTGVLAETFAETHFVWNSAIDWKYVDRVGADIVVTEMAERFHNLVPDDTLDVETFASERLAHFLSQLAS